MNALRLLPWVLLAGAAALVAVVASRAAGWIPGPTPPGGVHPVEPGSPCDPVNIRDLGERLTPGTVYRATRDLLIPAPSVTGHLDSGVCLEVRRGWRFAVQRSAWWADPWLPGTVRPGELAAASGPPVLTARPVIYAASPAPELDASARLQSWLIRSGVLEVG